MKKQVFLFVFAGVMLFVGSLASCARGAAPGAAPSGQQGDTPRPASGGGSWQERLDQTAVAARKEGKVRVYGELSPETRQAISQPFKDKYGIDVEFVVGKGAEIAQRITSEQAAGISLADVLIIGGSSTLLTLKPKGLLGNLDSIIVLPEINDPNTWLGRSPYLDKNHTTISLVSGVTPHMIVNTELVREGDVRSFQDLLKPQYKGRIVFYDPTIGGTANHWVTFIITRIYPNDRESAVNYLRQFAAQEPVVLKDARLQTEWVAQGKYPIAVGASFQVVTDFVAAGGPIRRVHPVDGTSITAAAGVLAVPARPEHPNAAAVLINWLLTEEGQRNYAEAFGSAAARIGVKTAVRDPSAVPIPGEKLIGEDEDFYLQMTGARDIARDIFATLMK